MMKKPNKSPTLQTETRVELFEQLLDAIPDPLLVKDCAGHYVWGNRAKLKELGVTDLSKIIGKTAHDFFDRATAEGFKSDDDRVVETGQPITDLREKIVGPDGTVRWCLTNKIPWRDSGGRILGLIAHSRDISSLVEAEVKLQEERNLLRTLVDNLPDAVYAKDAHGRKVMVNPSDLKNIGCRTEAEAIGKTDFDFFPREIAEQFFAAEMPVLKNGTPLINHEEMICLPNGERRWLLTSKIPWRDSSGKVIGLVGIGRDIHDQKVAEMNLQEERNLLRTLINNLPDPIYAKDVAARKIVANQGDLKNLGCSNEAEALGKTDFDFFPKEIAGAFFADDQIVLKEGKAVINREEKMVSKDGRTRWLLTSKIPWRDGAGKIIGLIGIGRDITEKKELEAQITQAQRMESIGRVATGIAHDLNNILTPILISIEILRAKLQDEEYLKMLAKAEASAHRGADILKQMLWFSRGLNGHRGPVNLQQLTGDIAQFTSENFGKSIRVEKQIAPNLGTVNGDSAQLHQVLMSLCSNARDAMPKGGALTIAARNTDVDGRRYVVLEVADTGVGFAPELASRIFEPFFTTKAVGHGLGLSTAHSIVKGHSGFIKTESQPGHGATFRVYLPVQL
ncbi:MAG TPA: PAS domain-containing protein [Verrucomicrobiae bacterium]|nr:PAS domain-containing protein [Verrucomicrobiae bacterium]